MTDTISQITFLDGAALLLVLGLAIVGFIKGAVRFVVGLVTVVAGIILAGRFGGDLGAQEWPLIADLDDPHEMGVMVGCGLLFAATLVVGFVLAKILRKAVEEQDLGGLDRLLGFVFGALRGALFASVLAIAFMGLGIEPLRADAEGSYTLKFTRTAVDVTRSLVPDDVEGVLDDVLQIPRDDAAPPTGDGT